MAVYDLALAYSQQQAGLLTLLSLGEKPIKKKKHTISLTSNPRNSVSIVFLSACVYHKTTKPKK
jgi:hypothetical protein